MTKEVLILIGQSDKTSDIWPQTWRLSRRELRNLNREMHSKHKVQHVQRPWGRKKQHVQEAAKRSVWPEQKDWGIKGFNIVHLLSWPPSQPPNCSGDWGTSGWGGRGDPAHGSWAPELTAECCTRAWKLMAANRFAGEADVQQRIPVLFFRAELHGHPPSQALWSWEARSMRAWGQLASCCRSEPRQPLPLTFLLCLSKQREPDKASFQPQLHLLGDLRHPSHFLEPQFPHLWYSCSELPSLTTSVPFSALFFALLNVPLSTTVPLHKMLFSLHKMLLHWLFSPDPLDHC